MFVSLGHLRDLLASCVSKITLSKISSCISVHGFLFPSVICVIFLFSDVASISVQLLQKLSITAVGKREKLLRVIKNPVTQYLPIDCRKIGE